MVNGKSVRHSGAEDPDKLILAKLPNFQGLPRKAPRAPRAPRGGLAKAACPPDGAPRRAPRPHWWRRRGGRGATPGAVGAAPCRVYCRCTAAVPGRSTPAHHHCFFYKLLMHWPYVFFGPELF